MFNGSTASYGILMNKLTVLNELFFWCGFSRSFLYVSLFDALSILLYLGEYFFSLYFAGKNCITIHSAPVEDE